MPDKMITNSYALDQYADLMGEEGKDFIIEIIDTLLEDAPKNFALLDQSLIDNDFTVFQRAAHTLKSSCATVGANVLADKFLVLEKSAAEQNLSSISHVLDVCKFEFQLLQNELLEKKQSLWNRVRS